MAEHNGPLTLKVEVSTQRNTVVCRRQNLLGTDMTKHNIVLEIKGN